MEGDISNLAVYSLAVLWLVVVGIPVTQILHRTGFSRAWVLIGLVPVVNLIFLWIYAFIRWPVEGEEEGKAA